MQYQEQVAAFLASKQVTQCPVARAGGVSNKRFKMTDAFKEAKQNARKAN